MKILNDINDSTRASVAYIFANILSKGVNFITIPIFTRLLTTSEMGITTTFNSWQIIIYAIFSLGLVTGSFNIAMVTYEIKRDKYMSVALFLTSVSSLIFLLLAFTIFDKWEKLTKLPSETLWIMVLFLFFQPAMDFWLARQRYENKYKSVFIVSVLSTFLSGFISVIAVMYFYGIENSLNLGTVKIISQYCVLFIFSFFLYVSIFVKGKTLWDKDMAFFAISLSLPLIIHSLAKNILSTSDRIMIANIQGQAEAGIYGTIYTISLMALVVWNAINGALVPEMFQALKNNVFVPVEKKIYNLIVLFAAISIVAVLLSPEILFLLTTKDYYGAIGLMPPLFASVFLTSIYNIYGNFLLFKKHTFYIMAATIFATIFNIVANFIFISRFGFFAAAYTTLASSALLAIGQGLMQRKAYETTVINNYKLFILGLLGTLGCVFASFLFNFTTIRYLMVLLLLVICLRRIKNILFI